MSFKLSVRQGPRPNLVFELDQDSYTIGREAGNSIVIEDPQVSRLEGSCPSPGPRAARDRDGSGRTT